MTEWAAAVLAEVQKIDPGATIVGGTGVQGDPNMAGSIHISVNGIVIPIGNGTDIAQVARLVMIYAPPPVEPVVVDPTQPRHDPDPAGDSTPFLRDGRWFKYGLFGILQSCEPPTATQIPLGDPSIKPQILEKIKALLVSDPPLTKEAAQVCFTLYGFVQGLKG